jgi:hypothetical protein
MKKLKASEIMTPTGALDEALQIALDEAGKHIADHADLRRPSVITARIAIKPVKGQEAEVKAQVTVKLAEPKPEAIPQPVTITRQGLTLDVEPDMFSVT